MQFRNYQHDAHAAIRAEYLKKVNHQLVAMATGTGKTVIFAQMPQKLADILPGKTLVLAHREELIDQAVAKMRAANPLLRIDKEMAEHRADPSTADCIVASVATLTRPSRQRGYDFARFDKWICDEAHHSTAPSYLSLFQAAGLYHDGDTRLLCGFTATPQRGDGTPLAKVYQKIVYTYGMRQAIADGWLVDPAGIRVHTGTSLDKVKTTGGDYNVGALAETVNTQERNQIIVEAWLEHGVGRRTIAFCVDIQHAKDLTAMFREYGAVAEAVWGTDPSRSDKLEEHRYGKTEILCNCGILTEGYDDPGIGCVILGRPTKSSTLFTQMVGRGTRLEEGCDNLLTCPWATKRDCIIIDVVDASSRHSLITLPTLLGMSGKLDLQGKGVYAAVQQIEQAQKLYPQIDFTQLADLSGLKTFIEKVNLFDIKYAPEVESSSELSWHPAATGGYILLLPNDESIRLKQNLLDIWEISGIIKGQRYRGERGSIEEAFTAADTLIQNHCQDALKILRREEAWHHAPATESQLKLLMKLFRGKPLPLNLDKGKASRLISSALAGKK